MRRDRRDYLLACALTALLGTRGASAHGMDAEQSGREEIVVTATGRSAASSTTKTDTPIIASPQSISIISREEIDLRASPTIADALAYTAGVQAEPSGIDSRVDEVSVRGFGAGGFSSNNNFVDGLRLPSGGQWTRPGFDPFALQQIEVLKGPSGALYARPRPAASSTSSPSGRASPRRARSCSKARASPASTTGTSRPPPARHGRSSASISATRAAPPSSSCPIPARWRRRPAGGASHHPLCFRAPGNLVISSWVE